MKTKKQFKYTLIIVLLFIKANCFSQLSEYDYQAEINNVTDDWHTIELPIESYAFIKNNYADIRIFGLNKTDTIEIPYIREILVDKKTATKIPFTIINESKSAAGSFFTIKNEEAKEINEIELIFREENFDWEAKIEGSNDANNWFTVSEKERLVSLKKNNIDFRATTLNFPTLDYKFIRVLLKSVSDVTLMNALIYDSKVIKGKTVVFDKIKQKVKQDKANKTTHVTIQLSENVPISKIEIPINSDVDYYRRVFLKTLKDSVVLENRTRYNYRDIGYFEISSYKKNELNFNHVIANNLVIEIENMDNLPLSIGDIIVSGNPVILKARFPKDKLDYVLAVGNKNERTPNYDIAGFTNNIPSDLKLLSTNNFVPISKKIIEKAPPILPFPKYVLWIILISVIAILGFFTFKMFKK